MLTVDCKIYKIKFNAKNVPPPAGHPCIYTFSKTILELSPDHLVDDAGVALDDLHDLGRDVFFDIVGHRYAVVAVGVHRDGGVDSLQEGLFVDTGDEETGLVKCFGAFRAGADADCRERVANAREEGTFFGERAAVAYDGEGVHLQAVVIVEAERFVLNHALVELEAACGKAVTAARVAAVQNRHVVLFGHLVDGSKETVEVLLGVDVFFAVGAQQNVLALGEAETRVDIACLDRSQVLVQNFGHGAAGHVRTFLGQTAVGQVAAGVFGISHVHVADDIDDAAVRLFGEAFVLATVARFHVENRDVQAFCRNRREAAVGIAKDEHRIGLNFSHKLIRLGDNIANRLAEVFADGIHVDLRICNRKVFKKHTIEVVVVVLASVRENAVKVLATLINDSRKAYNFRARTHDDQ